MSATLTMNVILTILILLVVSHSCYALLSPLESIIHEGKIRSVNLGAITMISLRYSLVRSGSNFTNATNISNIKTKLRLTPDDSSNDIVSEHYVTYSEQCSYSIDIVLPSKVMEYYLVLSSLDASGTLLAFEDSYIVFSGSNNVYLENSYTAVPRRLIASGAAPEDTLGASPTGCRGLFERYQKYFYITINYVNSLGNIILLHKPTVEIILVYGGSNFVCTADSYQLGASSTLIHVDTAKANDPVKGFRVRLILKNQWMRFRHNGWTDYVKDFPSSDGYYDNYGDPSTTIPVNIRWSDSEQAATAFNTFSQMLDWASTYIYPITDIVKIHWSEKYTAFSPSDTLAIESKYYNSPSVIGFITGKWVMYLIYGKSFVTEQKILTNLCIVFESSLEKALVEGYAIAFSAAAYTGISGTLQTTFSYVVSSSSYRIVDIEEYSCSPPSSLPPGPPELDSGRIAALMWDLYDTNKDCVPNVSNKDRYGDSNFCDLNNGIELWIVFYKFLAGMPVTVAGYSFNAYRGESDTSYDLPSVMITYYNLQQYTHLVFQSVRVRCSDDVTQGGFAVITETNYYPCSYPSDAVNSLTTALIQNENVVAITYTPYQGQTCSLPQYYISIYPINAPSGVFRVTMGTNDMLSLGDSSWIIQMRRAEA